VSSVSFGPPKQSPEDQGDGGMIIEVKTRPIEEEVAKFKQEASSNSEILSTNNKAMLNGISATSVKYKNLSSETASTIYFISHNSLTYIVPGEMEDNSTIAQITNKISQTFKFTN